MKTREPHHELIPEPPRPEAAEKIPVSVVDRRRVGKAGGAPTAEPNLKPTFVQELEERTRRAESALKQRLAELEEDAARSRARIRTDLEQQYARKEQELLLEVLPILDDLDHAGAIVSESPAVAQGLALMASRAERFLTQHGCVKIAPEGEPFDPTTMEAVAVLEGPADTVVKVFRAGYSRDGALLRAAQVAVGKG
jgi:molecular chaperone GrpE